MNKNSEFFKYVVPSVLAFALSGVYTIVDGFFIGRSLGDLGLASITLSYPITAAIQAIGTGIGLSGAIRFTIYAAQNKKKEQDGCFTGVSILMLIVSFILTLALLCFYTPLLSLLGAKGEIMTLSSEYVWVIALGIICQLPATGLMPFIRNMGGANFAMIAMIIGFLTNVVLDYLFVWVFGWGMAGAAWATIIGQAMTALAAIFYFIAKKVGVYLPKIDVLINLWKNVLKVSVAPFGLTFSPIITMILMNRFLLSYGNEHSIAVYSCISYVTSIVYLLLQGVGDGSQPLISKYYGQNDTTGIKATRFLAYKSAAALTLACMIALFIFRSDIGILFGASPKANNEVIMYLPLFLSTMLFLSFVRITTAFLYATEKTRLSYILVYAEPVLTFAIMLILPPMTGLLGVWLSVPIAQIITWLISVMIKKSVDRQALTA